MSKFWVGVASADHVARGRADGFMQVCHGKAAPLKRITQGDGVVYYSPSQAFGAAHGLQSFTAIGFVCNHLPYQRNMGQGFAPFRPDVTWAKPTPCPIRPLLDQLDLTRGVRNWGYRFRFGLLEITVADFTTIGAAVTADLRRDVESGHFTA